ncbi:hypothetical protein RND81_10G090400 [Saponaria officinalis]|uniref:DUF7804 domain-containing protein n=1 Tax=Saponaria officinalis TaxID=3572 RepID=A0AAW1HZD3_SAPOF
MECLGIRSLGGVTANTTRVTGQVNPPGQVTNRIKPPPALTVKCTAMETVKGKEKFDHWMKDSVEEIVKNLQDAPMFVHVYGEDGPRMRVKTEKAVAEEWTHLKGKWVKGEEPSPEGIILVEELEEGNLGIYDENEGQNGHFTRAWGVLIQGKGENEGFECYLLKTSRVVCGNLGLSCTHYCLAKVQSFRETVRSQLISSWLV